MTDEEAKVEEHFQPTHRPIENGKFEVTLPLTPKVDELADNSNSAASQFLKHEKRLIKNHDLKKGCKQFMREYIDSGDMSPVDIPFDDPKLDNFYFTYHPTQMEDSSMIKSQIVFNGSLKIPSRLSLNDVQLNMQSDTQSLNKFRIPELIATADKQKCLASSKSLNRYGHCSASSIVKSSDPLQVYQLNTVTYGTKSASSTTTRCIKQLAMDFRDIHPQTSEILENYTYVGDVIFGFNSLDEQIIVTKDLLKITENMNLDLRKFKSNKLEALDYLSESKLEVSNSTANELSHSTYHNERSPTETTQRLHRFSSLITPMLITSRAENDTSEDGRIKYQQNNKKYSNINISC